MEHSELVAEMSQVEHLSTQDRLHLARMRRAHQLKNAKQKEKEWMKSQNRRDRNANLAAKKQRHIQFENSVVVLEAAARNDIEEVGRLLELGVSPDATNEDGLTPLHQCCIDNNADMLRLLLDYGAAVNAKDSEKWTPLHAAATCGHLYLVKMLISRGANLLAVNVDGNMPYDLCDDEETLDCIEAEMSRRGITQELIDETRAATENQMLADLNEVASTGGDLEVPDKQGATPLHIASANGYSKVVEFLLEHQACVDSVDKDLWTPVHAAACWGHLEVLEMLAMSGADLNARNKNEETPSDICEDAEIRERIEQLKTEQESKRQAEAQRRRVRRSQSNNTRAQSVRRTSLRDKTLTTKKDAVEETRLRLQAQEGFTVPDSTTEPSSIASSAASGGSDVPDHPHHSQQLRNGALHQLSTGHQVAHVGARSSTTSNGSGTGHAISYAPHKFDVALSRRSPDGKDNEAYLVADEKPSSNNNHHDETTSSMPSSKTHHHQHTSTATTSTTTATGKMGNNDISAEIFSTSNDNGKINVQVTVLVDTHQLDQSLAGTTLANLKKQRSQSRHSTTSSIDNGSFSVGMPVAMALPQTAQPQPQPSATNGPSSATSGAGNQQHIINNNNNNQLAFQQHQSSSASNAAQRMPPQAVGPINAMRLANGHQKAQDVSGPMHQRTADVQTPKITKFSGVTSDVVSDSTSRRCCAVM